jgi:hypothetical protein
MVAKRGGTKYIYDDPKTDYAVNRPINDRHKVLITDADCTVTN